MNSTGILTVQAIQLKLRCSLALRSTGQMHMAAAADAATFICPSLEDVYFMECFPFPLCPFP